MKLEKSRHSSARFHAERIERAVDPGIDRQQRVAQRAEPSGFSEIIGQGGPAPFLSPRALTGRPRQRLNIALTSSAFKGKIRAAAKRAILKQIMSGKSKPRASRSQDNPFWRGRALTDFSRAEWESLCDGCGRCCLVKLEDEDSGEIHFTDVGCRLLDPATARCRDYGHRARRVRDCIRLTPESAASLTWLPPTCAYRLLARGEDLPDWHPLVSGRRESVVEAGDFGSGAGRRAGGRTAGRGSGRPYRRLARQGPQGGEAGAEEKRLRRPWPLTAALRPKWEFAIRTGISPERIAEGRSFPLCSFIEPILYAARARGARNGIPGILRERKERENH